MIGPDARPTPTREAPRRSTTSRAEAAVREMLLAIGEDPDRDGLRDTPARVARAYAEMFAGLRQEPEDVLTTTFDLGHDEMVLVKDIEVYSHLRAPPGAVPRRRPRRLHPGADGRITGLSKLARLVDVFARGRRCRSGSPPRSPTRSMRTSSRAASIVVIECEHLCMTMRGVRKPGAKTVTSAVRGQLLTPPPAPRP